MGGEAAPTEEAEQQLPADGFCSRPSAPEAKQQLTADSIDQCSPAAAGDEEETENGKQQPTNWEQLPCSLWEAVVKELAAPEVCALAQVSTRLRSLCEDDVVWRTRCAEHGVAPGTIGEWGDAVGGSHRRLYAGLLHRFAPLLGLWQDSSPGVGSLVSIELSPPLLIGSTVTPASLHGPLTRRPFFSVRFEPGSAGGGGGGACAGVSCLRPGRARPPSAEQAHAAQLRVGGADGGGHATELAVSCVDACRHELWELHSRLAQSRPEPGTCAGEGVRVLWWCVLWVLVGLGVGRVNRVALLVPHTFFPRLGRMQLPPHVPMENPAVDQQPQQPQRLALCPSSRPSHAAVLDSGMVLRMLLPRAVCGDFDSNTLRLTRFKSGGDSTHHHHQLEGLWRGTYGAHGIQLVCITLEHGQHDDGGCSSPDDDDDGHVGGWASGGPYLRAVKVLGDVNMPSSKTSFLLAPPLAVGGAAADDAPPFSLPAGTRSDVDPAALHARFGGVRAPVVDGEGFVALPGFRAAERMQVQALLLDGDTFGLLWRQFDSFALFTRVLPGELLPEMPPQAHPAPGTAAADSQ